MSSVIISQMNVGGRIAVCGSISAYNAKETPEGELRLRINCFNLIAIAETNRKSRFVPIRLSPVNGEIFNGCNIRDKIKQAGKLNTAEVFRQKSSSTPVKILL